MSVYSSISPIQLNLFLDHYSLGQLKHFSGIEAGTENTNYRLQTTQGSFILTLYEHFSPAEIPPFLTLLEQLAAQNFLVPHPLKTQQANYLTTLVGKPAVLFTCLTGQSLESTNINQCQQIGRFLAQLHTQTAANIQRNNTYDLMGCHTLFEQIKPLLSTEDQQLITTELHDQNSDESLPQGLIHADLFKDNVLFNQGQLSGVLDFYNACQGSFIFDLAITVNDWCFDGYQFDYDKKQALLTAYQSIRTLTDNEIKAFNPMLRLTALRFWLGRVRHQQNAKQGELVLMKDPLAVRRLLEWHRNH